MSRKNKVSSETESKSFPTQLRFLMKEKGITMQKLGDEIHVQRQTISNYALGQSSPDWETLLKIAEYFDVSVDWLLGRDGSTRSPDPSCQAAKEYTGLSEHVIEFLHSISTTPNQHMECINEILSSNCFIKKIVPLIISINIKKWRLYRTNDLATQRILAFTEFDKYSGTDLCAIEQVRHIIEAKANTGKKYPPVYGLPPEQDELLSLIIGNSDWQLREKLGDIRLAIYDFMNASKSLLDDVLIVDTETNRADELISEIKLIKEKYPPIIDPIERYNLRYSDSIEEMRLNGNDDEENE